MIAEMNDADFEDQSDYYAGEEKPVRVIWLTGEDREIISSG